MKEVYIVHSTQIGWDSIVGVFDVDTVTEEKLKKLFPTDDGYYIRACQVARNTKDFE